MKILTLSAVVLVVAFLLFGDGIVLAGVGVIPPMPIETPDPIHEPEPDPGDYWIPFPYDSDGDGLMDSIYWIYDPPFEEIKPIPPVEPPKFELPEFDLTELERQMEEARKLLEELKEPEWWEDGTMCPPEAYLLPEPEPTPSDPEPTPSE